MKRTRTILLLPSGHKIRLGFGSCLRCRKLLGVCRWQQRLMLWDSIGFNQDGLIQFAGHTCQPERRRDLARDAKLEADRGAHRNRSDT